MVKSFLRKTVLMMVLALFACFPAMAADVYQEAEAVSSQKGVAYTVYMGMPGYEVTSNFSNLPGWSGGKRDFAQTSYRRMLSVKNVPVKQVFSYSQTDNDTVYAFSNQFYTKDKKVGQKIYDIIYKNLANQYPNFTERVPYGLHLETGKHVFYDAGNGVTVMIDYIELRGTVKNGLRYLVWYDVSAWDAYYGHRR